MVLSGASAMVSGNVRCFRLRLGWYGIFLLFVWRKGFMSCGLWPIWNQIFVMMFLAVWSVDLNIMTGYEWDTYRFGR